MAEVSSDTPLRPDAIEGLDAEACARLRRLGVDNLGELAGSGALELAHASELGVTRIMRWQASALLQLRSHARAGEPTHTLQPAPRAEPPAESPRFSPTETDIVRRTTDLQREIDRLAEHAPRRDRAPSQA